MKECCFWCSYHKEVDGKHYCGREKQQVKISDWCKFYC